jgi:hypothetical protein
MKPISMPSRHSGAGRNPVEKMTRTKCDNNLVLVCFAEFFLGLDSGLRRNDVAISKWTS